MWPNAIQVTNLPCLKHFYHARLQLELACELAMKTQSAQGGGQEAQDALSRLLDKLESLQRVSVRIQIMIHSVHCKLLDKLQSATKGETRLKSAAEPMHEIIIISKTSKFTMSKLSYL